MICAFELGFVGIFVAIFEFAMFKFFEMAIEMIISISNLFHSRISASFLDCMVIVKSLVYCWFLKPPRKPPDKCCDSISRKSDFLADCWLILHPIWFSTSLIINSIKSFQVCTIQREMVHVKLCTTCSLYTP